MSASWAWVTFGLMIRTGALTWRSTPGTVSACAIRCSSAAAFTRRPFCSFTFSSEGKSTSASRAGRFSFSSTRSTSCSTAAVEYDTRAETCASSSPPVMSRATRLKMLPSRLAWIASSTIPPTSAFTPASSADIVKRDFPRTTETGRSSGSCSSRRTRARASSVDMPPTSTPATVTPSAIRSSRELSYANAATAPPIRTSRTTATRMNHLCLMVPIEGTDGFGPPRPLRA